VVLPFDVRAVPVAQVRFLRGSADACGGGSIELDGSGSVDALGKAVVTYAWDLAGDASSVESIATAPPAFTATGASVATLKVTDERGCVGQATQATQAIVARPLPSAQIAFLDGSADVCLGNAIALSAAGSHDAQGAAVASYAWDFDSNGTVDATAVVPAPLTPAVSSTVRLTVRDTAGCEGVAMQQISPRPLPQARAVFTSGSDALCAGQRVVLDAGSSADSEGKPVASYAWDIDGVASTVESSTVSSGPFAPGGAPARSRPGRGTPRRCRRIRSSPPRCGSCASGSRTRRAAEGPRARRLRRARCPTPRSSSRKGGRTCAAGRAWCSMPPDRATRTGSR
jgi:hypothetical protein